jgi:hypothetical protein
LLWLSGCNLVLGIDDVSSLSAPDGGRASQSVAQQPDAIAASADGATPEPNAASELDAARADAAFEDARAPHDAHDDAEDAGAPDLALDAALSDDDAGSFAEAR